MCSVLLAYVVAHGAIVVMLIFPVHTIVIDIVSDVVLANADIVASAGNAALLTVHINVIDIVSDVMLAILILFMFIMLLVFFVIALRC